MLNIFDSIKPYTYHQLVDQENKLYIVSNDNINFGVSDSTIEKYASNDGSIIESRVRVPLKYEIIKYYRIDRFLAKYQGKLGFVSADIIPYIYKGSKQDSIFYRDHEIVIPFLFDKIDEKGNNLFEVEIDGLTLQMDIEGVIEYQKIELLKQILNPHYIRGDYDSNTNILIPECLNYTLLDENKLCLQPISEKFLNMPYYIVGRGWIHESSDDCSVDWEEYTIHGVIDNDGKCIIPCIFEQIEELDGLLEGFILAKYRNYFSDGKDEESVSYSDEDSGDLYLFTCEGECVLGGFSKIDMEDKDTIRIYLKDYIYDSDGSLRVYDSSSYIILNQEFALKEIANPDATYRNVYLDSVVSERNPFHVDLLKRLKLHVTPVPPTITHHDREEVYPDCFCSYDDEMTIDDPLDAFDGDVNAYNEWRS